MLETPFTTGNTQLVEYLDRSIENIIIHHLFKFSSNSEVFTSENHEERFPLFCRSK